MKPGIPRETNESRVLNTRVDKSLNKCAAVLCLSDVQRHLVKKVKRETWNIRVKLSTSHLALISTNGF